MSKIEKRARQITEADTMLTGMCVGMIVGLGVGYLIGVLTS